MNTIIDATEHLENAENLEQEIENGKAEISSLEVECTSADIKPLPAEIKPIPVDIKPKPVDMKPIPADTLPLSAENKPISADTQPISTDMKPTPADTHPLSDENVHKSADIKPKKVDIKPISADTQPIANDSQENSADSLLTGQTKAQDLTTDDLVSTDETLKLISDDHTEEPDHAEHVEINDEHVEMMNEDFEMIASNGSLLLDIGSGPEDERNQAMEYGESTSETEFEIIPEPESEEYTTTQYLEYPETVVQDQKAFDEVRQEVGKVNEVSALEIVPVVHVEHEERDDDEEGAHEAFLADGRALAAVAGLVEAARLGTQCRTPFRSLPCRYRPSTPPHSRRSPWASTAPRMSWSAPQDGSSPLTTSAPSPRSCRTAVSYGWGQGAARPTGSTWTCRDGS